MSYQTFEETLTVNAQDKADAERYRWLKSRKSLSLYSDGTKWTRKDGSEYTSSHYLAAGQTRFSSYASLDETIDEAMKVQP